MGFYMRFFVTDTEPVTLGVLDSALRQVDSEYALTDRVSDRGEFGLLRYADEPFGEVDINAPGDGVFEEEIAEFLEFIEDTSGAGKARVQEALNNSRATVAIKVLFFERETEETLKRIDPVWNWLFANREGILQVDREGFYDQDALILQLA